MEREQYQDILRQYWGYDDFRGIQWDIIQSITQGHDTLGLMPTGGGKSITFQVPALSMPGICIVVTPLIALMKDQVQNLRRRGIKAAAIYSGMSHQQTLITLENCIFGDFKLLYVSPERLSSPFFQTKLQHMRVSFITVDEAHCISQWGHDFRPAYLQIAQVRQLCPHAAILALTATATPQVATDIQQQLAFRQERIFRMSFERKNLHYMVRYADAAMLEIKHILNSIPGSSIIYLRNREKCVELTKLLTAEGYTATFYHAGIKNQEKDERQAMWQRGDVRIMVATNAFGMGIDKPDVRSVIHVDIPDSIEAYFQEAGRAGRDGKDAYAICIYTQHSRRNLSARTGINFPPRDYILHVYEQLCYFLQIAMGYGLNVTREFSLVEFCRVNHFSMPRTDSALKLLSLAGYITYTEPEENVSRIIIRATRRELYSAVETGSRSERIISYILRHHTAVFAEFVHIDEDAIARSIGIDYDAVYQALTQLNRRKIVDYVPRKNCQYITFNTRRIEPRHIILRPEVYEERKQVLENHIQAMRTYCEQTELCRSRFLLRYFGEEDRHDCHHCDVCRESGTAPMSQQTLLDIRQAMRTLLQDGPQPTMLLRLPGYHTEDIRRTIDYMREQGELIPLDDGNMVRLAPTP